MKTILKNKWHLHSLLYVFALFLIAKVDIGIIWQDIVITLFWSLFVAIGVELVQGLFFGANKTPEEIKQAKVDVAVGFGFAVLAVIQFYTITLNFVHVSLSFIGGVLILQAYKDYLKSKNKL